MFEYNETSGISIYQQIIDFIEEKAKLQNYQISVNENGRCLYRSAKGSCFVGMLIPDEIYNSSMEEMGGATIISAGYTSIPVIFKKIESIQDFLSDLQELHDQPINKLNFLERVKQIESQYSVKFSEDFKNKWISTNFPE